MSTINTVSQMSSFNPQQMSDFLITNMLISKIGGISADASFSLDVILKFLVLMSMNEIKTLLTSFLTFITNQIKKIPEFLISLFWILFEFVKNNKSRFKLNLKKNIKTKTISIESNELCVSNNDNNDDTIIDNDDIVNINLELDNNAIIGLYHYLQKNKNCRFDESLISIKVINTREKIFSTSISSIVIDIGDDKLFINNELSYDINIINDEIIKAQSMKLPKKKIKDTDVNKLTDLLKDKQSKIINDYKEKLLIKYKTIDDLYEIWVKGANIKPNYFNEIVIINIIAEKYPNITENIKESTIELIILSYLYARHNCYLIEEIYNSIKSDQTIFFDKNNKYDKELTLTYNLDTYQKIYKIADISGNLKEITGTYKSYTLQKLFSFSNEKSEVEDSKLILINLSIKTKNQGKINNLIKKLLKKIDENNKNDDKQIKIYYLQIQTENKISTVLNPEYENWVELKDLVNDDNDKLTSANTESNKDNINNDINNNKYNTTNDNHKNNKLNLFKYKIPPKTIDKIDVEKKIITKQLNETEKDIDTLYLRKKDKEKLVSSLYQFKEKKHILKSLGLQNKLNILLYGEPGTGKSSTIQSIATYLQRNIYYIDLKEAQTNQDLQMMFEYVNKNVQNGGIIVLEDIDAMTNVVLKRSNEITESTTSEIINNQNNKLSLEYLLNILQGTLTLDNSIFIVTTNHIQKLDPAFYRDGRFDVKIELKLCDHYQINSIYKKMLGRDLREEIIRKIKEDAYSPATIIYHIKNYIFTPDTSDDEIMEPFIDIFMQ